MKAWDLHAFGRENLKLVDKPVPQPGPTEVLIRVSAVSLNYRDKLVIDGLYNPAMSFPMTQVADAVGEVVAKGRDVSRLREGVRVVTNYATRWIDGPPRGDESTHTLGSTIQGALAEYLVLDEQAFVEAPAYLSDIEAAAVPCAGLTAWYALVEKGQLAPQHAVLVQGTGGVSVFGVQIATALGARVIVTSSSDDKLRCAKVLGAWEGINYKHTPNWEQEVLRLTSGCGVDQVLEVTGGTNLARSIEAIRAGGTISVIGFLEGFSAPLPVFPVLVKQVVLRGISVGPRRALENMLRLFAEHEIRPVIDKIYNFDDALSAYDHLSKGAFGKIVISVSK